MQIDFNVLKGTCVYITSDNEDEWCKHKNNEKNHMYGSCKEELCPLQDKCMLNVYVLERQDDYDYDEYTEQTIVAETGERAIELASKEYGVWGISKKVDLNIEQVLTKDFNAG